MDYIFGNRLYDGKHCEFLKTQGESYTDFLEGTFISHVIETPIVITTHNFRIIRKFKQQMDLQGNYCTWYYIDNHTTDIDRTPGINQKLDAHKSQLDEQSEVIDDILIDLLNK